MIEQRIADVVARHTRDIADFPSPGVVFKDLTPLFADPAAFGQVLDLLAERHDGVDVVAGVEARGFIIGAPLAQRMGVGFVPIRKKGKLPGDVVSASYDLEYGSATIEVQTDAVTPGANVLVVDDVLATGGTAVAACELIEKVGGRVACLDVLVELAFLPGRERLDRWELHTGLVVN
ncbi:adenine phosphoribosyltransferase [Dermacoccus nishinomiyaensis]|uniref:Adenine phosphoribosyltransferase n=1 Tax=Dermacoccus nishinomiyaensis TaxID=1274 RepID=A0A075JFN0_9MICO|nr:MULTISPECIES: adenine phosphoribosyltransferase [Dermacoccus]AIF40699.1 adenine phosphoribosyltransferase [Dermacoccus nishinomiyaensis]MCG7428250.1 adenine phosphoribosyltransferase [Dermacoccus nishinomiyaensis]MCI0152829.1 adenine phosphoribosyltransferase [Dermacoccus nishinomiyaensis]MCT1604852.1 adenine phosphoribosyltransferase [Dermacoccus nishinomiyaensis]PZP01147.1 MAG: adenine phosphoribosyltransferase [Dermacoccus nishinomiyaensis]